MKKFFLLLLVLFISYFSWPLVEKQLDKLPFGMEIVNLKSEIDAGIAETDYAVAIDSFFDEIHQFLVILNDTIDRTPNETRENPTQIAKPDLAAPTKQIFSIHNIELGEAKVNVDKVLGVEKRSSFNEYGLEWFTYHENYQNFLMVAFDKKNNVASLYTNQDLISSTKGIKIGTPKDLVRNKLGKPLTKLEKESVLFNFNKDADFDVYFMSNSYVTIFYDKHQENTVTSLQIIAKEAEQNKRDVYTEASPELLEGFEYQLFDLTNATRVKHGLSTLTWNDHVKQTARKHSLDMAKNDYFAHENLDGKSPFDRMQEDNLLFSFAGENLAYGQFSSIFAHEGLMNSLGHRENILRSEFQFLGVGVAFNSESQPYYTENFYAK